MSFITVRYKASAFSEIISFLYNELISKLKPSLTSLIFKSNLELALSIILKQRELYESKHVVVERRCLKK